MIVIDFVLKTFLRANIEREREREMFVLTARKPRSRNNCFFLLGWGGVKFLHTHRAKNNKRRSFPPAIPLHTCTRAWLATGDCHYPPYANTKFSAFASMLPRCTVHMLGNFIAFVLRVWDGPIVFQRLQHFTTSKPSTNILWCATLDIPSIWCGVTRVL